MINNCLDKLLVKYFDKYYAYFVGFCMSFIFIGFIIMLTVKEDKRIIGAMFIILGTMPVVIFACILCVSSFASNCNYNDDIIPNVEYENPTENIAHIVDNDTNSINSIDSSDDDSNNNNIINNNIINNNDRDVTYLDIEQINNIEHLEQVEQDILNNDIYYCDIYTDMPNNYEINYMDV